MLELILWTQHQRLLCNIKDLYLTLPYSSKIKSSVIQTLFHSISASQVSSILGISKRRVELAVREEIEPLDFYLRELGFTRVIGAESILMDWFEQFAPYNSGRTKRY